MNYFLESSDLKVKENILQVYGKSLEDFKKDVGDVKILLKTQPHLPQVLTDRQIEAFLIISKLNKEKATSKIDMYFSMRLRFPNVFVNSHPLCERLKKAEKFVCFVPVPKLCPDLSRLLMVKLKPVEDAHEIDPYACLALLLNVIDIRFFEDMCNGHTVIFDLKHVSIGHLLKMTPTFIKTLLIIGDRAMTTRVTAIHLINAPGFIDQTVFLVKSIVKPKLASRILVHKSTDSAVESLDKNVLPKDYGGDEKTLAELEEIFLKKFEEYKDFFDKREQWKVDEDLRPEKCKDDGLFGCFGNFKQLEVD